MMTRQTATRRTILKGVTAASALVAAPAYLRHATAATPIKIGIPTVITGGYALLGSQVIRTCKLVKKMTDAKGGLLGQPVEFFFGVRRPDLVTPLQVVEAVVSDVVPDVPQAEGGHGRQEGNAAEDMIERLGGKEAAVTRIMPNEKQPNDSAGNQRTTEQLEPKAADDEG